MDSSSSSAAAAAALAASVANDASLSLSSAGASSSSPSTSSSSSSSTSSSSSSASSSSTAASSAAAPVAPHASTVQVQLRACVDARVWQEYRPLLPALRDGEVVEDGKEEGCVEEELLLRLSCLARLDRFLAKCAVDYNGASFAYEELLRGAVGGGESESKDSNGHHGAPFVHPNGEEDDEDDEEEEEEEDAGGSRPDQALASAAAAAAVAAAAVALQTGEQTPSGPLDSSSSSHDALLGPPVPSHDSPGPVEVTPLGCARVMLEPLLTSLVRWANEAEEKPPRDDHPWTPLTVLEMRLWLSLFIHMMLNPGRSVRDFWASGSMCEAARHITEGRWVLIAQRLHLTGRFGEETLFSTFSSMAQALFQVGSTCVVKQQPTTDSLLSLTPGTDTVAVVSLSGFVLALCECPSHVSPQRSVVSLVQQVFALEAGADRGGDHPHLVYLSDVRDVPAIAAELAQVYGVGSTSVVLLPHERTQSPLQFNLVPFHAALVDGAGAQVLSLAVAPPRARLQLYSTAHGVTQEGRDLVMQPSGRMIPRAAIDAVGAVEKSRVRQLLEVRAPDVGAPREGVHLRQLAVLVNSVLRNGWLLYSTKANVGERHFCELVADALGTFALQLRSSRLGGDAEPVEKQQRPAEPLAPVVVRKYHKVNHALRLSAGEHVCVKLPAHPKTGHTQQLVCYLCRLKKKHLWRSGHVVAGWRPPKTTAMCGTCKVPLCANETRKCFDKYHRLDLDAVLSEPVVVRGPRGESVEQSTFTKVKQTRRAGLKRKAVPMNNSGAVRHALESDKRMRFAGVEEEEGEEDDEEEEEDEGDEEEDDDDEDGDARMSAPPSPPGMGLAKRFDT